MCARMRGLSTNRAAPQESGLRRLASVLARPHAPASRRNSACALALRSACSPPGPVASLACSRTGGSVALPQDAAMLVSWKRQARAAGRRAIPCSRTLCGGGRAVSSRRTAGARCRGASPPRPRGRRLRRPSAPAGCAKAPPSKAPELGSSPPWQEDPSSAAALALPSTASWGWTGVDSAGLRGRRAGHATVGGGAASAGRGDGRVGARWRHGRQWREGGLRHGQEADGQQWRLRRVTGNHIRTVAAPRALELEHQGVGLGRHGRSVGRRRRALCGAIAQPPLKPQTASELPTAPASGHRWVDPNAE